MAPFQKNPNNPSSELTWTEAGITVGGQLIGEGLLKKLIRSAGTKALSKYALKKITSELATDIVKIMLKNIVKRIAEVGLKEVAIDLAKAVARSVVLGAEICGVTGAETLGAGCVVAAVITALLIIFDVMNILLVFFADKTLTTVFDQAYLDEQAKVFKELVSEAFTKFGMPDYFEEEIEFSPLSFIYDIDLIAGTITYTSDYGPMYKKYVNEYLKTHTSLPDLIAEKGVPIKTVTPIIVTSIVIIIVFMALAFSISPWFLLGIGLIPGLIYIMKKLIHSTYLPSEEYAISQMCTAIPSEFGRGLTEWDPINKKCKITDAGCSPSDTNPISRFQFSSSGKQLDFSQDDRIFGKFWKYWYPDMLVKKVTTMSPKIAVCSRANSLFYQWLKYPETRSTGGEQISGVTNVPPFEYSIRNGVERGLIPEEYCKSKGVSYDAVNFNCYVSKGQQIAEFLSSEYLVRKSKVSDQRLKTNIKFVKTIAPGVDVYTFTWKKEALRLYGNSGDDIGFIADKLDPKYVIVDKNGYKNINTDIDDMTMKTINIFIMLKQKMKKNSCKG